MRLINADDLIERINAVIEHGLADPDGLHPVSAEVVLETINVIPTATPEPHWIPVTERLPAIGKSVLMRDIDGDIYLGHRTQCGYYYPDFYDDRVKNVTAWMPLPEPYKGVTP